MALWDRDVAKARLGYPGERAATKPPKAADECNWDDWMLAMLKLSQRYEEYGHINTVSPERGNGGRERERHSSPPKY